MAYSKPDDLLTGDLMISSRVDKGRVVDEAAEEIDSKLGFIYALPLAPASPATALPIHELLLLKQINNKLASGRLILTLDIAGEGTTLHAYGLRLVTEAMQELMLIANGTVDLTAVRVGGDVPVGTGARSPSVTNVDATSAIESFYEWARKDNLLAESYPLSGQSVWSPGAS